MSSFTTLPTILDGKYRLIRPAGSGGTANVFLAEEIATSKPVAVKVLKRHLLSDADMAARFAREAAALRYIRHPNVIGLIGFEDAPEGLLLLLEWVDGQRLDEILAQGVMPSPDALTIVTQLASALAAIHAQEIVHRDLKPENVMIVESPNGPVARLLAFGIARFTSPHLAPGTFVTNQGIASGSPTYLSPEQARGESPDTTTDVYSWGVVAYEMLTGRPPFTGGTDFEIFDRKLHQDAPVPIPVDRTLRDHFIINVIRQSLKRDRRKRPADGAELLKLLQFTGDERPMASWWRSK